MRSHLTEAISVVICTCGRADMIGAAVSSVLQQDRPDLELIVVDQSADESTRLAVLAAAGGDDRLRYLHLPERGLSRAYNRGVREARNHLIAFTDDDCVAPPDWLRKIHAAFEANPDVDLIYGQVLEPVIPNQGAAGTVIPTLPISASRRISMRHGFRVFGMGANFAARRRALLTLGGFDEILGGGGPLQSAQDFDFAYRLCRAGGTILLEPEVVVRHYGARTSEEWPATMRSYGIGVGGFYIKHVRAGDFYAARLLARELLSGCARLAKRILFRQPTALYTTFLGNVGIGIRSSFKFSVDRRLRLYAPR